MMTSALLDILQKCTVKLSIPHQAGWGTGFCIDKGLIITCAHVLTYSPA